MSKETERSKSLLQGMRGADIYLVKQVRMQLFAGFECAEDHCSAAHHHDEQRPKAKAEVDSHVEWGVCTS